MQIFTHQDITAALNTASGGEVFEMGPGSFPPLVPRPPIPYSSEVVVRPLDPNNLPVFNGFSIKNTSNLRFENIVLSGLPTVDPNILSILRSSTNITFVDVEAAGDPSTGLAWRCTENCAGITWIGGRCHNFANGFGLYESNNCRLTGVEIFGIRSDGVQARQIDGFIVEDCHIHDFSPQPGDHSDMIQLFALLSHAVQSKNIIIRRNLLQSGSGDATQTIFMANGRGPSDPYLNMTIEDNVIKNAHVHGITVGETDGQKINRNTVLRDAASVSNIGGQGDPEIRLSPDSTNVELDRNIVGTIANAPADAVITGTLVAQRTDDQASNYYGNLFVNALFDETTTLDNLRVIQGSLAEGKGSSLLQPTGGNPTMTFTYAVTADVDAALCSLTLDPNTGDYTITPVADQIGNTSFEYTKTSTLFSNSATGTYQVNIVPPTVIAPDGSIQVEANTPFSGNVNVPPA